MGALNAALLRLRTALRGAGRTGILDLSTSMGLVMGLGLIQNAVLARILGPGGMGHVSVVNSTMGFTRLVAALGITVAILRYAAAQRDEAAGWAIYRAGLGWALASSLVASIGLVALARSSLWVFDTTAGAWIPVLAPAIPLGVLGLASVKYLQARRRMRDMAVLEFLARCIQVAGAVCGALLYGFPGFVVGYLIAAVAGGLMQAGRAFAVRPGERVSSPVGRGEFLRFGFWSVFTGIMHQVLAVADVMCVSAITQDSTATGLYGLAIVIERAVRIPTQAYLNATFPRLVGRAREMAGFPALRRRMQRNILLLALGASGAAFAAAPFVVPWLFGEGFRPSVTPLWILLGGHVLWALGAVQGRSLLAHNRVQGNFWASAIAAVANLAANLWLIPILGIEGAAIATASTYVLWSACVTAMCRWTERGRLRSEG